MNTERSSAQPAHLGWRLIALIYDALPALALVFVSSGLLLLARGGAPVAPGSIAAYVELALFWLVCGGYAVLSWQRGGQTMGMRPWRLRVVDQAGIAPSLRQLLIRYLIGTVSLGIFGLGFFWSLIDREQRTWHDLASRTRLVRLLT